MKPKEFTPTPIVAERKPANKLVWGFTLLEILISTVILALLITGLANIFVAGKRYILHTRSKMQTAELGRLFLAPLQMQVNQTDWGNNCLSNPAFCGSNNTILDGINYSANYNTSPVANMSTLRKVKVTIKWNETAP